MKLADISYVSEPVETWNRLLDNAATLSDLKDRAQHWRSLCDDAVQKIETWGPNEFEAWQKALKSERRGRFMGEEAMDKFSDILMPLVLFRVAITATKFVVPWGLAYIRLRDVGIVRESDGVARINEPTRTILTF